MMAWPRTEVRAEKADATGAEAIAAATMVADAKMWAIAAGWGE